MPKYNCCHAGGKRGSLHGCHTSSAHTTQLAWRSAGLPHLQASGWPCPRCWPPGSTPQLHSCQQTSNGSAMPVWVKMPQATSSSIPRELNMWQARLLRPGAAGSMHQRAGRLSRAEAAACQPAACADNRQAGVAQQGPHRVKMISSAPRAFTNLATVSLASLYFLVARALKECTPPAGSIERQRSRGARPLQAALNASAFLSWWCRHRESACLMQVVLRRHL